MGEKKQALQAGDVITGKYRLEEKIAEGGGGEVWRALTPENHLIALKFLKWSPLKSEEKATARFKSEFAILKNLSHPNIGKIYDFGHSGEADKRKYFFTSELLNLGDLKKIVQAPINILEDILLQSLRALEYLRNQQLLHLDIKPQNLMLRKAGTKPQVALIDFGLATFRPPNKPGGTANYMPPEVVARRFPEESPTKTWPAPDHRSDLYSLGITFYYLFTGKRPFEKINELGKIDLKATMLSHLTDEALAPSSFRKEIPAYLDKILLKLIERNPDNRYPTAAIAAQAIQFRSPRQRLPESPQTLLAYLPKSGKLIGRYDEQKTLEKICKDIAAGKRHATPAAAIVGQHGAGKSRLLSSIKTMAQQQEMESFEIDAANQEQILKLGEICEQAQERVETQAIFIENLHLLFDDITSSSQTKAALSALHRLIKQLQLQQRIADSQTGKFFLCFSYDNSSEDWQENLKKLGFNDTVLTTIELKNFSENELGEYLKNLLGEQPENSVIQSLKSATDGNPLFITEQLEQMISCGKLFTLAGRPDAQTLKTLGVDFAQAHPSKSLKKSLLEIKAKLSPHGKRLAEMIACWNKATSLEELYSTTSYINIGKALLELINHGLVVKSKEGSTYALKNVMASDIIEQDIPKRRAQSYHDKISKALPLESFEKDYHLARSSNKAARIKALKRLCKDDLTNKNQQLILKHTRLLFNELPKLNWQARSAALFQLGKTQKRMQQYSAASTSFEQLYALKAPKSIRVNFQLMALEQLGMLELRRRKLRTARNIFQKANKLTSNQTNKHYHGINAWKLRISNCMAAVDLREGKAKEAMQVYLENKKSAMKLSSVEQNIIDNSELGESLYAIGKIQTALPILQDELEQAKHKQQLERIANRHYLLGEVNRHHSEKNYRKALEHYNQALNISKQLHLLAQQVVIHNGLGNLFRVQGDNISAAKHYRASLQLAQQTESETVSVELMVNLGLVLSRLDQSADAVEYLEAALDFSSGPKGSAGVFIRNKRPEIYIALADTLYRKNDLKAAEHYLLNAINYDHHERLNPTMRYNLYGTLLEIYLKQGNKSGAKGLLPTLAALSVDSPQTRKHYEKIAHKVNVS